MRRGGTYFEQVPIGEAETVLRRAAALIEEQEKTPAPLQAPKQQPAGELLKQQEDDPSQGQL